MLILSKFVNILHYMGSVTTENPPSNFYTAINKENSGSKLLPEFLIV